MCFSVGYLVILDLLEICLYPIHDPLAPLMNMATPDVDFIPRSDFPGNNSSFTKFESLNAAGHILESFLKYTSLWILEQIPCNFLQTFQNLSDAA